MTLMSVIIVLLVLALIVWLTRSYLPAPFNPWVIIVAVALVILWLLAASGLLGGLYTPLHIR